MIFHLKHTETAPKAGPSASPAVPETDTSQRVLEPSGRGRIMATLDKPPLHPNVPTPEQEVAEAEQQGFRTETLSLVMLAIAVAFLLQMGFLTGVLNTYVLLEAGIFDARSLDGYTKAAKGHV